MFLRKDLGSRNAFKFQFIHLVYLTQKYLFMTISVNVYYNMKIYTSNIKQYLLKYLKHFIMWPITKPYQGQKYINPFNMDILNLH